MARDHVAVCRQCRREGIKLFLKGSRCFTEKCAIERRNYPPGQHGLRRSKPTAYGLQLREKQKAKRIYGVLESQFRRYFAWAEAEKGVTGENLLKLLERRLDNVVFRLGMAASRREGRQMVAHGHIQVNGRKVSVPSYIVRVGEVVQLRTSSKMQERVADNLAAGRSPIPPWLELDAAEKKGTCAGSRSGRTSRSPFRSSSSWSCSRSKRHPTQEEGDHGTYSVSEAEDDPVGDPLGSVRPPGGRAVREGVRPDHRPVAPPDVALDHSGRGGDLGAGSWV